MNTTKTRRITPYTITSTIVKFYLVGALAISFAHIIHAAAMLGVVDWQAFTVPFFIDGFAILGLVGRSEAVASRAKDPERARRFGFRLQVGAGALSLAANVFAGNTIGEQLFGVLVVSGFVVAEKFAEVIAARKPEAAAPQITPADVQAASAAAVAAALAQAAIDTQAAIAAAVADALAADQKRRDREERNARRRAQRNAPVSPATVAEIESSYPAPANAYEPAYL